MALIGPAQAGPDDYDRVISFGDSLSDNGNLKAAIGLPDYIGGRFSNGPTFAEILAGTANFGAGESSQARFWGPGFSVNLGAVTGDVNLAVGGARTVDGDLPSERLQIGAFLLAGGRFGENDLVTMLAGANDLFDLGFVPSVALSAAVTQTQNVGAVIGAGGRTILVGNLPDLGATPAHSGDPAATAATNAFNQQLDQGLRQLAAAFPQANIIQMDLHATLAVALANPAAFGFTNVDSPCFISAANQCSNPDQFQFWDGVHPTAAGHRFLAQYAAALLSTDEHGKDVAALGDVAVSTRLEASDILFRRGVSMLDDHTSGGLYAEIIGTGANDYQLAGIRAGFDTKQYGLTFGGALAHLRGQVDAARLNSDATTTQADIYALYSMAPFFVGVEGGVSFTDYDDIRRDTTFPTVFGKADDTDSTAYSLAATLGTQLKTGGITLTPALRVGYLSADVGAFSESAPLLALGYSEREIDAGFWTARLRASSQVFHDLRSVAYVEAGYEDLFSVEDGYSAKLVNNTAHAVDIDTDPSARGFFLKAGLSAYVTETATLGAEYGVSFQDGDDEVHSGRLTLRIPLGGPEEGLGGGKD